jgi:RNA polymerase sigma factor (sigma-70 family)
VTVVEVSGVVVEESFPATYERAHAATVRLAHVLCGDAGVAEELAHDAWVAAYRRHERQPIRDVEPYVRRAVVNAVRSRGRRRAVEGRFLRSAGSMAPSGDAGASAVGRVDDRAALAPLLQQLPERMRTCIALRFAADLSVAETAEVMGVSEGTVKSTTSKALARLRVLWREAGGLDG